MCKYYLYDSVYEIREFTTNIEGDRKTLYNYNKVLNIIYTT